MLRIPIARFPMGSIPRWRRWRLSAGFTATVCRTFNLFSGQPRWSLLLRCPRIVVLFAVLLVDCEEYLCILVGFLPRARHAIVCILIAPEEGRVVDWVGAEFFLLHLLQESNYSKSEFIQTSLLCRCEPRRSCRKIWCGVLSIRCQIMTSCIHHKRTIVRVSWDGLPVGPIKLFASHAR